MLRRVAALLLLLAVSGGARAATRFVVVLPAGDEGRAAAVSSAFAWARSVVVLDAARLAERFPPSPAAAAAAAGVATARARLGAAEAAFAATRFDEAGAVVAETIALLDALPPSGAAHASWLRAELLLGRVELARGRLAAADAAFAAAAAAYPEASLDEAEYPPEVVGPFERARAAVLAGPPRRARVGSQPPGAEVRLNGRLYGRTPVDLRLPPGRCRLSVGGPGLTTAYPACADQVTATLAPADDASRRDQLREAIADDPRWFLEPSLDAVLAAETGADWVLALVPARDGEIEAHLYWARGHAFIPLVPVRFAAGAVAEVGDAVRERARAAEGLTVDVEAVPGGAITVLGVAGDADAVAAARVHARAGGRAGSAALEPLAPGRFGGAVPTALLVGPEAIDVELWVEGLDAAGEVVSLVGDAEAPLRVRRPPAPPPPPPPTPLYARPLFWAGTGAAAAVLTVAGYFLLQPDEAVVTFGGAP